MPGHGVATPAVASLSQRRWPPMNHQGANPGSDGYYGFACRFIDRRDGRRSKVIFIFLDV